MKKTVRVRPKVYTVERKVCPICLGMFTPKTKNQKFCRECAKNRRYEIALYRAGQLRPICTDNMDELHAMNAEIEAYNKKHGTCLTYGKYIQAKNAGWLED